MPGAPGRVLRLTPMTAVPVRAMTAQERSVPPSGSESVGVRVRHVKLNTRILVHPGPGPPTLHRPRPSELDAAAAAARPACTQHQRRPNRAASPSCRLPWPRKRPGMHCPACARQPNRAASRRKRPKGGAGDGRGPGSPPPPALISSLRRARSESVRVAPGPRIGPVHLIRVIRVGSRRRQRISRPAPGLVPTAALALSTAVGLAGPRRGDMTGPAQGPVADCLRL